MKRSSPRTLDTGTTVSLAHPMAREPSRESAARNVPLGPCMRPAPAKTSMASMASMASMTSFASVPKVPLHNPDRTVALDSVPAKAIVVQPAVQGSAGVGTRVGAAMRVAAKTLPAPVPVPVPAKTRAAPSVSSAPATAMTPCSWKDYDKRLSDADLDGLAMDDEEPEEPEDKAHKERPRTEEALYPVAATGTGAGVGAVGAGIPGVPVSLGVDVRPGSFKTPGYSHHSPFERFRFQGPTPPGQTQRLAEATAAWQAKAKASVTPPLRLGVTQRSLRVDPAVYARQLNRRQRRAFRLVRQRKNVVLQGGAGTGKSFWIHVVVKWARAQGLKCIVTGSTGAAATLVNGVTLASWSGIVDRLPPNFKGDPVVFMLAKLRKNERAMRNWVHGDLLIVDEASMVNDRMLAGMDAAGRQLRRRDVPFGGLQVVLVGDFFQLEPVSGYSFVCYDGILDCFPMDHFERLRVNYRQQGDREWLWILDCLRTGNTDPINKRMWARVDAVLALPDGVQATELHPHKDQVDEHNVQRLAELRDQGAESEDYYAFYTSTEAFDQMDLSGSQLPWERVEETMELFVGAQVMLVHNVDVVAGLVNGAVGVIIGFSGVQEVGAAPPGLDTRVPRDGPEGKGCREPGDVTPLELAAAGTDGKSRTAPPSAGAGLGSGEADHVGQRGHGGVCAQEEAAGERDPTDSAARMDEAPDLATGTRVPDKKKQQSKDVDELCRQVAAEKSSKDLCPEAQHVNARRRWPIVRFFARGDRPEHVHLVLPKRFEYEQDDAILATCTQLPLVASWAMTVHKAQGVRLEWVKMSCARLFAGGHMYTAASRCPREDHFSILDLWNPAKCIVPVVAQMIDQLVDRAEAARAVRHRAEREANGTCSDDEDGPEDEEEKAMHTSPPEAPKASATRAPLESKDPAPGVGHPDKGVATVAATATSSRLATASVQMVAPAKASVLGVSGSRPPRVGGEGQSVTSKPRPGVAQAT